MVKSDKLINKTTEKSEYSIMNDMLLTALVTAAMSVYYYGLRAVVIMLLSVGVCVAADILCLRIRRKKYDRHDFSAVITGLVLAMMFPASVSYALVVFAAIFAIVIAKQAFGGHGHEIFNCAAAGYLFIATSFPSAVSGYPKPFEKLPLTAVVPSGVQLFPSLAKSVIAGDTTTLSIMDILIGNFCGPMGAGFVIILAIAAVFLMLRRSVSAISFFSQLAAVFCFSLGYYSFSLYDAAALVSGGMLLYGIIFLSCDYSTIPKTKTSRFMYGIIVGGITILFQFYGKVENAIVYAVIIAAPFGIELDKRSVSLAEYIVKKRAVIRKKATETETEDETDNVGN